MVYTVLKPRIGKIAVSTATGWRSRRASCRGEVGTKGVEEIHAGDQLAANFKRRNGVLVVLGIEIL